MTIVKVIDVIASSEIGIEYAGQQTMTEVFKSVRNIDSDCVKDIKGRKRTVKVVPAVLISHCNYYLSNLLNVLMMICIISSD